MNKKYILQIKRRYLWEDVATFTDFGTAMFYLVNFRKKNVFCRLLEVLCL